MSDVRSHYEDRRQVALRLLAEVLLQRLAKEAPKPEQETADHAA